MGLGKRCDVVPTRRILVLVSKEDEFWKVVVTLTPERSRYGTVKRMEVEWGGGRERGYREVGVTIKSRNLSYSGETMCQRHVS